MKNRDTLSNTGAKVTRRSHWVHNEVGPLVDSEKPLLEDWQKRGPKRALAVFETLRDFPAGERQKAPLRSLGDHAGKVLEDLNWLHENAFVARADEDASITWHPCKVPSRKGPTSFRGTHDIRFRGTAAPKLAADEQASLYGLFSANQKPAALYMLARRLAGSYTTKLKLSYRFDVAPDTIDRWLQLLRVEGLIGIDYRAHAIDIHPVPPTEVTVDQETITLWIRDTSQLVDDETPKDLKAGKSQPKLILDYYLDLIATRAELKGEVGDRQAGRKQQNRNAATNLAREYSFKELQGPLTFFCLSWKADALDRWGRTLQTFLKQYDSVRGAYEQALSANSNYVQRRLEGCGLFEKWGAYVQEREDVFAERRAFADSQMRARREARYGEIWRIARETPDPDEDAEDAA